MDPNSRQHKTSIDVQKLCPQEVTDAIIKSFAHAGGETNPPQSKCMLVAASLDHIKTELNLPLLLTEVKRSQDDIVQNVDVITKTVVKGECIGVQSLPTYHY